MRKAIVLGFCMMILLISIVQADRKTIVGWDFKLDVTVAEVTYDYTDLLPWLDDETEVFLCKWFDYPGTADDKWIPMKEVTKDTNANTLKKIGVAQSEKWALCIIDDESACDSLPDVATFSGSTTDFSALGAAAMDSVAGMILEKSTSKITWTNPVAVCGAPLDFATSFSANHVSLDMDVVDDSLDAAATININVDSCASYNLYYADSYQTSLSDVIQNGEIVATQDDSSCDDGTSVGDVCDAVSCSSGVLTIAGKHFDSYAGGEGGQGGPQGSIPEFSTIGIVFAIMISIIGAFVVITRK